MITGLVKDSAAVNIFSFFRPLTHKIKAAFMCRFPVLTRNIERNKFSKGPQVNTVAPLSEQL